ncbi:MAG: trk/ktr system potassium uptake protein [Actinomycetota bacterium]|nr:trk/ktr system potassium uptake protein [Actinomycetota bacterium]
MHVIIAGSGRVGSDLATNLEARNHSVVVVDKDERAFERLKPTFAGKRVVGFVFDREVLEEAGIRDASAFAAVTSGDNSNIVSARVAKEFYRIPYVVARIYDPRRAQIYQRLGIQTVATVRWTTDQILRGLLPAEEPVEYTVDNGEVVMTAFVTPTDVVGKSAATLDNDGVWRVVAVSRFGVPRVPHRNMTIQEGDILHVSVTRGASATLAEEIKKMGEPE